MRNKELKKVIILALALVLSLSQTVSAGERIGGAMLLDEDILDYAASPTQGAPLRARSGSQPSYDPRGEEWYDNYIDAFGIKNQKSTGLCWAFSATTAMELSYYKETGELPKKLSPGHIGYFFYNRNTDPLGLTAGDQNLLPSGRSWVKSGGYTSNIHLLLASWVGAATEEKAPTNTSGSIYSYDDKLCYDDELILENSEVFNLNDRDAVKAAIRKHGGVQSTYFDTSSSYNEKFNIFNNTQNQANHAIVIVGWDDNYSADKFKDHQVKPDDETKNSTPVNDGAWIILNSWGPDSGDNGYYYISYEDISLGVVDTKGENHYGFAYDMGEPSEYDHNYQYDGSSNMLTSYSMKKGQLFANVYKVVTSSKNSRQYLNALGFADRAYGAHSYIIRVYTDINKGGLPDSGTLAKEIAVDTETPGYHTVGLTDSSGRGVALTDGSYYSIVVEACADTNFCCENTSSVTRASTAPGQSFYKAVDSGWCDLDQQNSSARIKGLTKEYHVHSFTAKKKSAAYVKKAPTCTASGYYYYGCTGCDEVGTKYYKAGPVGHSYKVVTKPATVKANGYYYKKCSICGKKLSKTTIKKASRCKLKSTSVKFKGDNKERATVYVKDSSGSKISSSYYTITFNNNYIKRTGKAIITFKGRYKGTRTLTYKIKAIE